MVMFSGECRVTDCQADLASVSYDVLDQSIGGLWTATRVVDFWFVFGKSKMPELGAC